MPCYLGVGTKGREKNWNEHSQAKPSNELIDQAGKKESPHYSSHQHNYHQRLKKSVLTCIKSDRNSHLFSPKKSLQTHAWGYACVVFLAIQLCGSSQFCARSGGLYISQLEIAEPGWAHNFWSQPALPCFPAPLTLTSTCNLRAVEKKKKKKACVHREWSVL